MSWNLRFLVLAVGVLLAGSAAIAVFAGPDDTPADPPVIADEPTDGTDPEEVSLPPDDGDDDGDLQGVVDSDGQRDVLGVPDENTHPCDNVEGGCRVVENAGGKTLRLPAPAADAIEAACWNHDPDCHPQADDGAGGRPHDVPRGPPHDVPRGPPHDVPRGGPHGSADVE